MSIREFLAARRVRYVSARDVLSQMMSTSACTESEAAGALFACLADAGDSAPCWYDMQGVSFNSTVLEIDAESGFLMLGELQSPNPLYDPHASKDDIHDRWAGWLEDPNNVELATHYGVWFAYNFGGFSRAEIEPLLREAGLVDGTHTVPVGPDGQDVEPVLRGLSTILSRGTNSRAAVMAWVADKAHVLCVDGDTTQDLATRIFDELPAGALGERAPITVPSIVRMLPKGVTGGRAKNGRKSE